MIPLMSGGGWISSPASAGQPGGSPERFLPGRAVLPNGACTEKRERHRGTGRPGRRPEGLEDAPAARRVPQGPQRGRDRWFGDGPGRRRWWRRGTGTLGLRDVGGRRSAGAAGGRGLAQGRGPRSRDLRRLLFLAAVVVMLLRRSAESDARRTPGTRAIWVGRLQRAAGQPARCRGRAGSPQGARSHKPGDSGLDKGPALRRAWGGRQGARGESARRTQPPAR